MAGVVKGKRSPDHRHDGQSQENSAGRFQGHDTREQRDDDVKGQIRLRACDVPIIVGEFWNGLEVGEDMNARQVIRVIG